MSPEGIRLFFTNFLLVSFSHHNANSIAIFRHNTYAINTTLPPFYRFLLHFVDRHSYRAQPFSCFDDPI